MRILVIDVGGTHVKVLATGHKKRVRIPSGPTHDAREDGCGGASRHGRVGNMMPSRSAILGRWSTVVPSLSLATLGRLGGV